MITITVYLGSEKWDAPRRLLDMYPSVDERIAPYLQDYDAHVFVPSEFDDFGKFQTELKQLFEVLSAAGAEKKMKRVLAEDEQFQALDNNTIRTINDIAGTKIKLNEEGKVVNMCKAWDEHYESGKRETLFSLVSDGTLTLEVAVKKSGMSKEDFVKAMEAAGYKIPVEA